MSVRIQKGVSPFRANVLRPEVECNCVAERRGGEQQETNDQSVVNEMTNSIRPGIFGEPARQWRSSDPKGKSVTLMGNVIKRWQGMQGVWRRNDWKCTHVKRGYPRSTRTVFMLNRAEEPAVRKSERP